MISYYDLLGLIKEGKQPDRIWCLGTNYVYDGCEYCIEYTTESLISRLKQHYSDNGLIFEKVIEIIEDKPKEIEKICFDNDDTPFISFPEGTWKPRKIDISFAIKINELTKAINYLLKEDNHE